MDQTKTPKPNEPLTRGQALAKWRERMGFNVTDAAEALGCSRNAYTAWEADKSEAPDYIGLACAARAMGLEPIWSYPADQPATEAAE